MNKKIINVVKDFHKEPYGRLPSDSAGCDLTCGETFRKSILAPAIREYDRVVVDLTGYNRYGRSFLDEAFGGLIREENFSWADLEKKLTYTHDDVTSIVKVIDERIEAARRDTE
jgi:hypothetical protein